MTGQYDDQSFGYYRLFILSSSAVEQKMVFATHSHKKETILFITTTTTHRILMTSNMNI